MQIVKDNLRLVLLSLITGISISFSALNYSSEPEAPAGNITAEYLQELYLDFWYWLEGISIAQFMLAKERYGDQALEMDDLKRIYNLSFTASHVLDPYLFNLRNSFYTTAYQQGKPYNHAGLPGQFHQSHKEYIVWLHKLHERMSPYYSTNDLGKNIKQVFEGSYKNTYQESYDQFKQLMAHYDSSSKPHIAGLGEKRAIQWLRYEIIDDIYKQTISYLQAIGGLLYLYVDHNIKTNNADSSILYLSNTHLTELKEILSPFTQRSLVKELLPDLHERMSDIIDSPADTPDTLIKATNLIQDVLIQRNRPRPPYYMPETSMAFSRLEILHTSKLNLHVISKLSLEELEILKEDLAAYRETISTRAITPVVLMRELGISPELIHRHLPPPKCF